MFHRNIALLILASCTLASAVTEQDSAPPARLQKVTVQPTADCLRLPVGPVDEYYVAQGFTQNNHLGEDWNGNGGGNTDLGDAVYTVGPGVVTYAADPGRGWGNVVRVEHLIRTDTGKLRLESLYAHLDRIDVQAGDTVDLDTQIGTIGDAHGRYLAHLHLELRDHPGLPLGPGYAENTSGYTDPRAMIAAHQAGCKPSG